MNIRLKVICTLALLIPVTVVFFTLFHLAQNKNEEQRNLIDHTYQVMEQINILFFDIQDAKLGERGFVITDDKSFLDPFSRSLKKIDADLLQLRALTQDNVNQQQRLNEFEPVMRNLLSYLSQTIALRDEQGLQAAINRVSTKTGKNLMDRMRVIMEDMDSEERRLLNERTKIHNQDIAAFYKIEVVFVVAMGFMLLIIGLLLIRNIMRPLRALSLGTEQLAAGNYATRINFSSQDEFSQLAKAFNLMAEAIQRRTQELNSIVSTMVDGLIILDSHGGIRSVNPAAERLFGYTTEELVSKHIRQLLPQLPDDIERHVLTANTGYRCEINAERKDGFPFPLELTVSEMAVEGIRMFTCLLRDISAQKHAQMALSNNEARLRAVIEAVVEGIITIDGNGIIETINSAGEKIFGYQHSEVVGQNVGMLMPEPYHREHDDYLRRYMATGESKIIGIVRETVGKRKDGSVFPMELAVSEMLIDGRRMFTGLARDISERKAMERLKNEFISTVSHELRTPLTSIQGALGLILGGATGDLPEKSIKLLSIANNNCKRLVRLINDILDLEKFESGKMAFDIKPIEIMPLVEHCIEINQAYADEFAVTFAVTHEQAGAVILADSDRLTQVLTNLLSNAAKFSHRGGRVDVATSITKQRLRLSVTDYGIGIKEEFRDRIFKKFTQEDSTNTRQKGGTGLGLSISKAIIERLDGIIDYESEPDKKTTFFIELPLCCAGEILSATPSSEYNKQYLLILEDDPDVAALLGMMLAKRGYAADIACTAEQAKQMLNSKSYDAMTLDLILPGQSGIDFFRELREQELFKQLPVIVVSAFADKAKQELNGEALAIIDWLSKPIDEGRLDLALTHALRRNGFMTRILHVEDDPDIVHIVATLLQNTAEIDVAMDLATARRKLEQDYDLVILDIELPDGSAETLLPLLSNRDKPIPVVIFSASEVETADSQRILANFIKSKTSNEELMNKIESILKSRRKQAVELNLHHNNLKLDDRDEF
ncbi:MAG: PAS domain S-box protein [Methylobacter sp.]|jgi:PAS domain S-box-containing protein|nr:PAS domain S-box protein [Methylobacter sp.]